MSLLVERNDIYVESNMLFDYNCNKRFIISRFRTEILTIL